MNSLLKLIRFAFKCKGFAIINIIGLSVGITACSLITIYVKYHYSYDKQAPHPDRTYRVTYQRWRENGDRVEFASASPTIGPVVKRISPDVEVFARAFKVGGVYSYHDKVYEEEMAFQGESALFDILGFDMIEGNPNNCLDLPNQVVLSKTLSHKYFGDQSPIGKTIVMNGNNQFLITGVYGDCPPNVHFKPTLIISLATWEQTDPQLFEMGYYYSGFYTYVRLSPNANPSQVDKQIEEYIENEFGETLREYQTGLSFKLQPLSDIHLNSHFMHEIEPNYNKSSISMLEIIAWFILAIAWVNFFNLSTIVAIKRTKEIGIRKVNGATKGKLLAQLFGESAIINIVAIALSVTLLELTYSAFANIAGLPQNLAYFSKPWYLSLILIAFLVGTFSAGIYSVVNLKGNSLAETLRGNAFKGFGGMWFKKSLVTIQFAIAIALICGALSVYSQYKLLQKTDLGFVPQDLFVVKVPKVGDTTLRSKFWVFSDKANELPFIESVAYSSVIPGKPNMFNRGGIYRFGDDSNNGKNMRLTEIDYNFPRTYKITMLAGKGFSGVPAEDANNVMLNEKGAYWLGFESPEEAVGKQIVLEGESKTVTGILFDFKQLSPKVETEPQIFRFPQRFEGYFTLRLNSKPNSSLISQIEGMYQEVFPGNPFDYQFLDTYYNQQYNDDRRFGMVFTQFSILSIIITVLGLLGLSAYSAEQRKSEIGIRKVLGAKISSIIQLLFKEYILLWIIACAVAIPTVGYFLSEWLNNYAMRLQPKWWMAILPAMLVLVVAVVTVGAQSLRAATKNPVDSIKEE
jgi:putative ABC transport system permease protein